MFEKIKIYLANNHFFSNKINFYLILFLLLLNIIVWLFWGYKIIGSGYNVYLSTEIPIKGIANYTLPIMGTFFSLVNGLLAYYSSKKEILISYYLLSGGVLIEILILVLIRHYLIIII